MAISTSPVEDFLQHQMACFIGDDIRIDAETEQAYAQHECAALAGDDHAAEHAAIFQMWKGKVGQMRVDDALAMGEQFARQATLTAGPGAKMTLASILAIKAGRARYVGDTAGVHACEGEVLVLLGGAANAGSCAAKQSLPSLARLFSAGSC